MSEELKRYAYELYAAYGAEQREESFEEFVMRLAEAYEDKSSETSGEGKVIRLVKPKRPNLGVSGDRASRLKGEI